MGEPKRDENAPEWLNGSFIETALRKSFKKDDLKVLESKIQLATAVAENYASQMFRLSLTFKANKDSNKEKLSVIVKLVSPGKLGEELQKFQAYERERDAFAVVLPVLNKILEKAYSDHKKLWAECYYHANFPNYVLILEDLREKGYVLANRFEGLDMEHSVLALKSLAKLHAASLCLKKDDPEKLEKFFENCWQPKNAEFLKNMLSTPFKIMSEDILTWPECEKREIYSKKLKKLENDALDVTFKLWDYNESGHNVLLHGDAWVNNFMFKYDPNGKLIGINFVDFQIMNINNPAMDLQYFIFTSVDPSLRYDFVDLFLQTYHETFDDTLNRLGHKLDKEYSFEQLKKDFEEKNAWGLIVLCVIFPIFLVPSSEAFHPDVMLSPAENKNFHNAYKRKSLRETLIRGFKYFEEKGVF